MNVIQSLSHFIPEGILLKTAFIVLLLDLFVRNKKILGWLALIGTLTAMVFARYPTEPLQLFFGYFVLDPFSHFFKIVALGIIAITLLASMTYKPSDENGRGGVSPPSGRGDRVPTIPYFGEFVSLFLFLGFALILMASSNNLLMIFLSIEFVSILSYLLVGFLKKSPKSKESALKYLLFGSVSSGIMLYGMSLLFGLTGALDLNVIQAKLVSLPLPKELVLISLFLIMVGLGFKISMAPFHMWAPDVYEGAPTPVTAFLTVGPKALGFAIFLRLLHTTFLELQVEWGHVLAGLSMLTMTIGNVVAVSQTNIKRLLGYSSIAQAGYLLMGLAVSNETGVQGILIYLVAYALTNLGAFLCVIIATHQAGNDEIESFAGFSQKAPFAAMALTLFLLSLAGIPPLAGFVGKYFMFASAVQGGLIMLAVVAVLNSAVAAFYYFKIVRLMYLVPATTIESIRYPLPIYMALVLTLIGIVAIGIFPSPFIQFVQQALIL